MVKSFFIFWLRSNLRHPGFFAVKLLGFALGIASTILLIVFSANELTYDRFHSKSDRLYRLLVHDHSEEGITTTAVSPAAIAESLRNEIPEIEATVRLAFPSEGLLKWSDTFLKTDNLIYADSSFLSVFSFELKLGNPKRALRDPYSIILSESLSKNLFGDKNPIGETVILDDEKTFKVTGIIEDSPPNSQIKYQALMSFNSLYDQGLFLDWNGGWNYLSYVLLHEDTSPETIIDKSIPIFDREINNILKDIGVSYSVTLEPMTDSHLFSEASFDLPTKGSLDQIVILSVAGLFILIMSCINFISLSAVQAASRLKEIGIKKVVGVPSQKLFITFMLETVTLTLVALLIAAFFLIIVESSIQGYLGVKITSLFTSHPFILGIIVGFVVVIGFLSGAYPATVLSNFRIADAVKGRFSRKGGLPRGIKLLVLFQFTVTIILFMLTTVVFLQRDYILNKNLGFKKNNIIVLPLPNQEIRDRLGILETGVSQISGVSAIGASSEVPGNGFTSNGYFPEGHDQPMMINVLDMNPGFLETLAIEIVDGRNFNDDLRTDKDAYLINETLAAKLGWESPVGKTITRNGVHNVIGVVRDFHFNTLHHPIEPLIITNKPWRGYNYLFVQVSGNNITNLTDQIAGVWTRINPEETFDFFFLDQTFNAYYQSEKKLGEVFLIFAAIAVILCGSGLFATISFSMKNRIKEIGIRKILGANTDSLVLRIGGRQLLTVLIANIIAIPIALFLSRSWLEGFQSVSENTSIVWVWGLLFSLLIAVLTMGIQIVKAANSNPVDIIRQE